MSRYRFVSTVKAEGFPIDAACEAAEVSTSAYYDWAARSGPTEAEWDEALPRRAIIAWINHYNAVRLHSSLGGVPPIEWELSHFRSTLTPEVQAA